MKRILISRTDSIGDVVLTLPMATWLKAKYPACRVYFLGRTYTAPILRTCQDVDEVLVLEELANMSELERQTHLENLNLDAVLHVYPRKEVAQWMKDAGLRLRIGTAKRKVHWTTCNKRPWLSRRHSKLHEAQLNMKLLGHLGYDEALSIEALGEMGRLRQSQPLDSKTADMLDAKRFNIILHPRSSGSAREWGLENFSALIHLLGEENYNIILTGTETEGAGFRAALCDQHPVQVRDVTGQLNLDQLVSLIAHADGLVAASTGPLHIAAAAGIHALGLFIAKPPMHPDRWAPIGPKAEYMVHDPSDLGLDTISKIEPERVAQRIADWAGA